MLSECAGPADRLGLAESGPKHRSCQLSLGARRQQQAQSSGPYRSLCEGGVSIAPHATCMAHVDAPMHARTSCWWWHACNSSLAMSHSKGALLVWWFERGRSCSAVISQPGIILEALPQRLCAIMLFSCVAASGHSKTWYAFPVKSPDGPQGFCGDGRNCTSQV